MAISIGSVEVDVIPSTRGIYNRLRDGLVPAATRAGEDAGSAAGRSFGPAMQRQVGDIGLRIGEQIGQQIASRITASLRDALRDGVTRGGQAARPAAVRQGEETGGAFARSMKAKLEAAFRNLPKANVSLDDTGVDADLARLRARMETLSGKRIGVDVDVAAAQAEITDIEERLRRLGAAHPNVSVRADTAAARAQLAAMREEIDRLTADPHRIRMETDGSFGARLRAAVQAAEAALSNVNIGADTTPAEAEIASLRAQLTALRDQRIGIDIDAATATAKISEIQARLERLSASDADVNVRVDSAAAVAQLAQVQAMVSALDGKKPRIDIDTMPASAAMLRLAVAVGSVGAIPALPALLAGLGAIASVGTAAAVGVGAVAAVAVPAFKGIAGVLQAQKQAQDAAASATARGGQTASQAASKALQMAGAQQALATAHRNAARQIGQAEQGVSDAVRQAAEANRTAAQQVRTARQGLADAYQQAADRMRSANEQVQSAERSLADAQDAARQAQQDLTQARKDAAQQLEDLSTRLADAQLNERDAALSVQEAEIRLRATQVAGSKATVLQQQRAQLAYDQAVQRLKEQRQETARTAAEKAKADRAGVEGSDVVKSAQERLAQAQQAVRDQQAGLAKAQAAAARQQIQNTKDIAAAQDRVAEAQRNVTKVQEDGARSVARAQESLAAAQQSAADSITSAQRQIESAAISTAGGVDQAALAQQNYQKKLAGLTPAARDTLTAFVDLKRAFGDWSKALQPDVMPIFTRGLKGIKNSLPGLTPIVKGAADGIKKLQDRASEGFKKPWWKDFKRDLAKNVGPAIEGMGITFGRIFKGMVGIIDAFLIHTDGINDRMEGITGRFADWGTGLKGSPAFERFLDYTSEMGPKVATAIKKIANAFLSVAQALAPLDGPLLDLIGKIADGIVYIADNMPWLIQGLWGAYVAWLLFNLAMKISPIGWIAIALVGLVIAIKYAWDHFKWFRDIVKGVWSGIKTATSTAWTVVLKPVFQGIWAAMQWVGDKAMWLWHHGISPAFDGIGGASSWLYKVAIKPAFDSIKGVFRSAADVGKWLWKNALSPAFHGIADVARWLHRQVIKPVFNGISGTISYVWKEGIRPTFNAIKSAIGKVADAFGAASRSIKTAWDKIKGATKSPVNWVLRHVWNEGVVQIWRKITGWIPNVPKLGKVDYLASGGQLRGPQPGMYNAPTAIVGEGNPRHPEYVIPTDPKYRSRALALHQAAGTQLLAKGGVIGSAWDGISDVGSAIGGFFSNPMKKIKGLLDPLLSKGAHLKNTSWGKMVLGLPRMAIKGLKSLASSALDKLFGGGSERVVGALKWARSQAGMPYQWGGVGNPSWDCSGFMGAIQKVIEGKNPRGRIWSTFSFQGKHAPKGWVKDLTAPFMVGITNRGKGHTAGTLAGVNVESRGGDGVVVGKRARGARSSFFDSVYGFRPSITPVGGSATQQAAQATARQMMGEFGFGPSHWPSLKQLWEKESGWRWNATNPISHAYGIPQCVDLETRIMTRRGWLRHDEVCVGDQTIGYDMATGESKWTEIKEVYHYERAEMVTVDGDDGWAARCTRGHRWLRVTDDGRTVFVTATELVPGMRLLVSDGQTVRVLAVRSREAAAVWCVTTGLGTWTAEQDGQVFLTGNSLPGSKMRSAGADWMTNSTTQIRWGLGYIKGRYGNPSRAYDVWSGRHPHWYDSGGYLQPGLNLAYNGTGRPEPVLTNAQWGAIQSRPQDVTVSLDGQQMQLVLDDGAAFTAHLETVADGRIAAGNRQLISTLRARRG